MIGLKLLPRAEKMLVLSHDWLNFVKSPKARNKIRQWFTKERRTENMEEGRDELTRALRRRNLFTQKLHQT